MRKIIDKITGWLVSFKIDFYLHILFSIIIATIISKLCVFTGAERILAGVIGAFIGLVIGFCKEVYDNKTTGVFEAKDLVADLIGAILFFIIFI